MKIKRIYGKQQSIPSQCFLNKILEKKNILKDLRYQLRLLNFRRTLIICPITAVNYPLPDFKLHHYARCTKMAALISISYSYYWRKRWQDSHLYLCECFEVTCWTCHESTCCSKKDQGAIRWKCENNKRILPLMPLVVNPPVSMLMCSHLHCLN